MARLPGSRFYKYEHPATPHGLWPRAAREIFARSRRSRRGGPVAPGRSGSDQTLTVPVSRVPNYTPNHARNKVQARLPFSAMHHIGQPMYERACRG